MSWMTSDEQDHFWKLIASIKEIEAWPWDPPTPESWRKCAETVVGGWKQIYYEEADGIECGFEPGEVM